MPTGPRSVVRLAMLGLGLAAALAPGAHAAPDDHELRLRFAKGDRLTVKLEDRHDQRFESQLTGEIAVTFEWLLHFDWQVTAVDAAGVATGKATLTRFRVAFESPAASGFALDTEAEGGGPGPGGKGGGRLAALKGKTFTLALTAGGGVKKVAGMTALLEPVVAAAPDATLAKRLLDMECADAALAGKLAECCGPLPKEKQGVGAVWPAAFASRLPLTGNDLSAAPGCRLEKVEGGTATITVVGEATGKGGPATLWDDADDGKGKGGGGGGRGGPQGPGGFGGGMGDMVKRALKDTMVEYKKGELTGARELDLATGTLLRGGATWRSEVGLQVKLPAGMGGGGGGAPTLPGTVAQKRTLTMARVAK